MNVSLPNYAALVLNTHNALISYMLVPGRLYHPRYNLCTIPRVVFPVEIASLSVRKITAFLFLEDQL